MWSEVLHQFWVVDSLWQSGWETLVVSDVEHWKCSMYWMDPCSILCKFFSPHPTVPWYTRYHIISTCLGSNYSDGYPDRKHLLQGNVGWWNIIIIMFFGQINAQFPCRIFPRCWWSVAKANCRAIILFIYIYIHIYSSNTCIFLNGLVNEPPKKTKHEVSSLWRLDGYGTCFRLWLKSSPKVTCNMRTFMISYRERNRFLKKTTPNLRENLECSPGLSDVSSVDDVGLPKQRRRFQTFLEWTAFWHYTNCFLHMADH